MRTCVQLYESRTGPLVEDWTNEARDLRWSANKHGFGDCTFWIALRPRMAYLYYERVKGWLVLSRGGVIIWEGRWEEPLIDKDRIELTFFGAIRAFSDLPYTAFWSTTRYDGWRSVPIERLLDRQDKLYAFDVTGDCLKISLQKNAGYNDGADFGSLEWFVDSGSVRSPSIIQFDYLLDVDTSWRARAEVSNRSGTSQTTIWGDVTSAGSVLEGSVCTTFTADERLLFSVFYKGGGTTTNPDESGVRYLKITNLRIASTSTQMINTTLTAAVAAPGVASPTVGSTTNLYVGQRLTIASGASDSESVIVTAVGPTTITATFAKAHASGATVKAPFVQAERIIVDMATNRVAVRNPGQIGTATGLIQQSGVDLLNENYTDANMIEVMDRLAALGDNATPPRQWECGVSSNHQLYFRPRLSAGRTWFLDDDAPPAVNRELSRHAASAYPVYTDAEGVRIQGATSTNAFLVERFGLTREVAVPVDTTSLVQANIERDAFLEDHKYAGAREAFPLRNLYDAGGSRWPVDALANGDQLVARRLPVGVSSSVDGARIFRVESIDYEHGERVVTVQPEAKPATLDAILARREALEVK